LLNTCRRQQRFERYLADPASLAPDLRFTVYKSVRQLCPSLGFESGLKTLTRVLGVVRR
jgi:hypothetical protein